MSDSQITEKQLFKKGSIIKCLKNIKHYQEILVTEGEYYDALCVWPKSELVDIRNNRGEEATYWIGHFEKSDRTSAPHRYSWKESVAILKSNESRSNRPGGYGSIAGVHSHGFNSPY